MFNIKTLGNWDASMWNVAISKSLSFAACWMLAICLFGIARRSHRSIAPLLMALSFTFLAVGALQVAGIFGFETFDLGFALVTAGVGIWVFRNRSKLATGLANQEERLRAMDRELKSALQTRDEFMSLVSHELKTPVTTLSLYLQMVTRNTDQIPMDRLGSTLQKCDRQCRRICSILDKLVDLTLIRTGKLRLNKERVELTALVKEAIENFNSEIPRPDARISMTAEAPITGSWDRIRLEQVIYNLLSNAIKYGNEKPIDVSIEPEPTVGVVRVRVKDAGIGIPPRLQDKIFDRYARAVPESKGISGLGMGLFIVRQIVEAHGGGIRVESDVERGATFTVDLPIDVE